MVCFHSMRAIKTNATSQLFVNLLHLSADCRLHVSLYYRESLVKEVTTNSPEGCRISSSPPPGSPASPSSPCPEERLYGGAEPVLFPFPYPQSQRRGAEKLPNILERGVLLWLAQDGLYAKRLCQGRVYWEGPLAPYADKPNKLEKEQTCKLMDTQQFLSGLKIFSIIFNKASLNVWLMDDWVINPLPVIWIRGEITAWFIL